MDATRPPRAVRAIPPDILQAARLGARLSARWYRARGIDDLTLRLLLTERFRRSLDGEGIRPEEHGEILREFERGLEEVLGAGLSATGTGGRSRPGRDA